MPTTSKRFATVDPMTMAAIISPRPRPAAAALPASYRQGGAQRYNNKTGNKYRHPERRGKMRDAFNKKIRRFQ